MSGSFDRPAGLVTRHPRIALGILAAFTAILLFGTTLLGPQAGNESFLPSDSPVAQASGTLSEEFPDSAGLANITIIHRGEFLTPEGLDQIDRVIAATTTEPSVGERLALTDPVVSIAGAFKRVLDVDDLSEVGQTQIDTVASQPEFSRILDELSGESDGEPLVISTVKLRTLGDADALSDAELLIADLVTEVEGPLDVRSLSSATIDEESAESSSSSTTTLILISLAIIVLLLFVFFRSGSDVALSLAGLSMVMGR